MPDRMRSLPVPAARGSDQPERNLDGAHAAVWDAIRHLFPSHAMVNLTDQGCVVISWTMTGERGRGLRFAAPVLIRVEPALLLALRTTDPIERKTIARLQARIVRAELAAYDPYARIPTSRVIVLGEEAFA